MFLNDAKCNFDKAQLHSTHLIPSFLENQWTDLDMHVVVTYGADVKVLTADILGLCTVLSFVYGVKCQLRMLMKSIMDIAWLIDGHKAHVYNICSI